MDVTANNIANVNTTGYNAEKIMFTDYLVDDGNRHKMAFAQDISSYRDTSPGGLQHTGNALDVAIQGRGYFAVDTPYGERFTRAGSFQIDPNGILTTVEGYPVLAEGGAQVEFTPADREIKVLALGQIVVDGQERANLKVVSFENEQEMVQTGENLYKTDAAQLPPQNVTIVHGALESSNVKPVKEMVELTRLSRSTSSTAKYIEVMYDLQRKASNAWAKQEG
jgi:flagellar basal-body rod protein FlgF